MKPINGWTKESMIRQLDKHLPIHGRCIGDDGTCAYYRPSDGARCAAGAFLPDDPASEGIGIGCYGSITSLLSRLPHLEKFLPLEPMDMQRLQNRHDGSSESSTRQEIFQWIEDNIK